MARSVSPTKGNIALNRLYRVVQRLLGNRGSAISYNRHKWRAIAKLIGDPESCRKIYVGECPGNGVGAFIDERIVEYPILFHLLGQLRAERILDAGSVSNYLPIVAHPLYGPTKTTILTLAYEGRSYAERGISYVFGDLRRTVFRDESFDFVYCVSTLEHVGMDNTRFYTSDARYRTEDDGGYVDAILELRRVTANGGCVLITVPCGLPLHLGWLRIFDEQMVQRVVEVFGPTACSRRYYRHSHDGWLSSLDSSLASGARFYSPLVPGCDGGGSVVGAEALAVIVLEK